jgi:membrane associated rhomboid family serine protease
MSEKENRRKRLRTLNYGFIIYLTAVMFLCQWLIFREWNEIGLSMLLGTCGTLAGCFAALLASPYGTGDQERLSKVGSIISTLITGYVLAKIVDPVISVMTDKDRLPMIFDLKIGANALITIIGFLAGFLLVYQYRAYISGEISDSEHSTIAVESAQGEESSKTTMIDEPGLGKT